MADDTNRNVTDDEIKRTEPDANPDPITGAPGSHPVGTGVGAAVVGAGATWAGAAIGAAVSGPAAPIGGVVGAVVGAIAGGYAGKAAAEAVDPTTEEAYWRENYKTRPYFDQNVAYDEYAPAYRYGVESRQRFAGRTFDEVHPDLEGGWEKAKGASSLTWEKAKAATRDAWDRVESGMHRAGQKIENATDRMTDRARDVGRTPADTDRTNPDIVVDNGRVVKDERSDLSPDRAEDATSRDIRRATNEAE